MSKIENINGIMTYVDYVSTEKKSGYDRDKASAFWARGIDWCVRKVGNKWALLDCFGNFPLFKTKKAAYEMATAFVLMPKE